MSNNIIIKVIDKLSGKEVALRPLDVSWAEGSHLVFGWETCDHFSPEDAIAGNYEITFEID